MRDISGLLKLLGLICVVVCATGCASNYRAQQPQYHVVIHAVADDDGFDDFDEFGEFGDTATPEVYDPFEGYNRFMFKVNDSLYVYVIRPAATGYAFVVPEPARVSIKSLFKNLLFPVRLVNNLLQLKFKEAGVETLRFGINTTVGLAGLFDPAASWFKLEPSEEDFGQTMGSYGVGEGFPLVLPLFGFSNLRDGLSRIPDAFLNPVNYLNPAWHAYAIRSGELVNEISIYSKEYDSYKKDAVDPYIFFRNAYKQNRDKKVKK